MHRQAHRSGRTARGFTFVELLTGLALCALLACLAAPSLQQWVDGRRLEGVATQLAADLRFARNEALARQQSVRVGFRGVGDPASCYVVYSGAVDACRCTADGQAECKAEAQALRAVALPAAGRIRLAANVGTMSFDALHGTSTPAASLQVVGAGGRTLQHVVNVLGRVRTCSPQGSVAGYPPC